MVLLLFENLVNQECKKNRLRINQHKGWFENLVNQECRKTQMKQYKEWLGLRAL